MPYANHDLLRNAWKAHENGEYPQSQISDWHNNWRSSILTT